MRIGVLALQGAVSEHELSINKLGFETVLVRNGDDLSDLSGLVMPGGESTTLRKLLKNAGLWERLDQVNIPIMGTCAGAILIGDCGEQNLGKIDMEIDRNYSYQTPRSCTTSSTSSTTSKSPRALSF